MGRKARTTGPRGHKTGHLTLRFQEIALSSASAGVLTVLVQRSLKALGRGPDAAQQGELFRLVHFCNEVFKRFAGMSGELGVNADDQPVQ